MKKHNTISKVFLSSILLFLIFGFCCQAVAADLNVPNDPSSLNSFIILAIDVSKYVLGIVGSLTLLMFVIGGVQFMISAGSTEAVSKAKKTITAAVVGLLIVFSSWLIINFVVESLGISFESDPNWKWENVPQMSEKEK